MNIIVFEYKACSIEYFLDKMQMYELDMIMEGLNLSVKNDWEITREIMWSNLAPYSKHKIKPEDVMKLPWDKGQVNLPKVEVTKELQQKMMKLAEQRKEALIKAGVM